MAGLPTVVGRDGQVQNPTMMFRLQGVDVERFLAAHGPDSIVGEPVARRIAELNASGRLSLPRARIFLFPTPRPGELLCNATRIGHAAALAVAERLSPRSVSGRDVRELLNRDGAQLG